GGTADRLAIGQALLRRDKLRESAASDLQRIISRGGRPAGIAAVLLRDQPGQIEILAGKDRDAQIALLARARALRDPLPLTAVGDLYKLKDARMSLAADRYLESEDSPEARKLVLSEHPGEAMIIGAPFNPDRNNEFNKWEEKLRETVRQKDG